ncbi:hypothetical protein TYRP_021046 [Tyrophagus putrescentiae]|nr:hypothetical protein TYRP_021046 [Tyrophagus putrescentiae]
MDEEEEDEEEDEGGNEGELVRFDELHPNSENSTEEDAEDAEEEDRILFSTSQIRGLRECALPDGIESDHDHDHHFHFGSKCPP